MSVIDMSRVSNVSVQYIGPFVFDTQYFFLGKRDPRAHQCAASVPSLLQVISTSCPFVREPVTSTFANLSGSEDDPVFKGRICSSRALAAMLLRLVAWQPSALRTQSQ
jgi:hypothetical protein